MINNKKKRRWEPKIKLDLILISHQNHLRIIN